MTTIYERCAVKCPYAQAREFLHQTLEAASRMPQAQRLPLIAPLGIIGDEEKTVLVRYRLSHDRMHLDEPWHVSWTPEDGGPYPDFTGDLTVRADESYERALLELRGEYEPPLGAFGHAFDLIAGSKIASATARTLLINIGTAMETRFKAQEAAKVR